MPSAAERSRIMVNPTKNALEALGPWSVHELSLIYAAARAYPGTIGPVPACHWWPAFILVLLDTCENPARILEIPRGFYDEKNGELGIQIRRYRLSRHTIDALRPLLSHSGPMLFPWPRDTHPKRRRHLQTMRRHYLKILRRAGLAAISENLFVRLLMTARRDPEIVSRLILGTPLPAIQERSRDLVLAVEPDLRPEAVARPIDPPEPEVVQIQIRSSRTLIDFFESSYRPLRLPDAQLKSIADYRVLIKRLGSFLACNPTAENLTDDCAERFMAWLRRGGASKARINGHRAKLLALWRHAWRKRLVDDLPRDVPKYRVAKRIPECWSIDQVSLILKTASETRGRIRGGIPVGDWWVALILVLYDTGLRISTVRNLKLSDLNWQTRFLSVPAESQKQYADQVFRLHPDTMASLERLNRCERELLLPPRCKKILFEQYHEILERAGLPNGPRDMFHRFRRTSATAVANAFDEQAAKQHLGHSSLNVTRLYLDPRKLVKAQSAADQIERPAWKISAEDNTNELAAEVRQETGR